MAKPQARFLTIVPHFYSKIAKLKILTKMTKYADYHFQSEEQYMLDFNYPDYDSHKKQHIEFMKKTVAFCLDTMSHKDTIPSEILEYLGNWLTNHILESDMKFKEFFDEKGLI